MEVNYKRKKKRLKSDPDFLPLSYCEIFDTEPISELKKGMDFREPAYRREVFLRFYDFHLKWRSHPGCVYYLFPYIFKRLKMTQEQKLWFAFLNGCTQNPCTTYVIFNVFPDIENLDLELLEAWHSEYWRRLDYDTDKRYSKGHLVEDIECYLKNLGNRTQVEFFKELMPHENPYENFYPVWDKVLKDFMRFGRLGAFSYLEYLKISGLNLDCPDLFFDDLSGSKSHRNGILKILGRDDLDWHKSNQEIETHPKELVDWVDVESEKLLKEAKGRNIDKPWFKDVSYFTLESAFCTFKSHFRVNRRYPNVYNDMLYKRIKKSENMGWEDHGIDFDIFWKARSVNSTTDLLLEFRPNDPTHNQNGLSKEKQNHFRLTGQMIMLDVDDPVFENDFSKKYLR